jgi:HSP20 family molecular chaperone IbpA
MIIVKYDSYDLDGLFNWDSLLDRLLNNKAGEIYEPAVRFEEDEEWYILNMDLSGINKKNIDVSVKDNRTIEITVRKYKNLTKTADGTKVKSIDFKRTFVIPYDADETDVTWEIRKGILKCYVGKFSSKADSEFSDCWCL